MLAFGTLVCPGDGREGFMGLQGLLNVFVDLQLMM